MDRLEMLVRLAAGHRSNRHADLLDAREVARRAVLDLEALVAEERETRPKCMHTRANNLFVDPTTMRPVCHDCGQVVPGEPA